MQKFSAKTCRSSVEINEDEAEMSPIKFPRKALSPTQLMRIQMQKNTEKVPSPLKLQLEPLNNKSGGSWSSISSLEERAIESPLKPSPENKKPQVIVPHLPQIQFFGTETEQNEPKEPKVYKDSVCLSERKFVADISKPSLFMQRKKEERTLPGSVTKRESENLKPILEEESPLMKIIRKKKEQDKTKNLFENFPEISNHGFRSLIFAPHIDENLFKKHLLLTYKGIVYAKRLSQPSDKFLEERGILLPEQKDRKKTLFMDLDETLIHSCHIMESPEIVLEIRDDISLKKIGFNVRPYCTLFLEKVSKFFEIYVFTASSELYAKSIIAKIDPNNRIQQIFNKNSTMNTKNGFIIKDLRIFKNRNLKDMIIVDNLAHSFSFQLDNGIPLLEWQSDRNDQELKYLYKYLKKASEYPDVRTINREYLKLDELGDLRVEDLGL